jgi:hypothetical protein
MLKETHGFAAYYGELVTAGTAENNTHNGSD